MESQSAPTSGSEPADKRGSGKKAWKVGLLVLCGCLFVFACFLFESRRRLLFLPFLANKRIEYGAVLRDREVGVRQVLYICEPYSNVKSAFDTYRMGSGSGFEYSDSSGYGNDDTGEAWTLYRGKVVITAYPYLGDFTLQPGTRSAWTTLVYREAKAVSLYQVMRFFK
jgi:hypothetical protein